MERLTQHSIEIEMRMLTSFMDHMVVMYEEDYSRYIEVLSDDNDDEEFTWTSGA